MSKLLSANFVRLKKNKLFWAEIIVMLLFALFFIFTEYIRGVNLQTETSIDRTLLTYTLIASVMAAVFGSIFLGTEYGDGTIRNKMIIGHSRINIYLANLITNIFVSFIMCLLYISVVICIGIPLVGDVAMDKVVLLKMILGTFATMIAFCTIFTTISMICQNKAASVVMCTVILISLFVLSINIFAKLAVEPYTNYFGAEVTANGETVINYSDVKSVPNPDYLTGTVREVYEFFNDFLPTGQAIQYMSLEAVDLWQMPVYSLCISIFAALVGIIIFRRENIK